MEKGGVNKICIAIYKPIKGQMTMQRLREAQQANPDGCGLLFCNDKRLVGYKNKANFDNFFSQLVLSEIFNVDSDKIIHFRTASSGKISDENCHPFFVNDNLAFVENGNLFHFTNFFNDKYNDDRTDIQRFNDEVLKKLPDGFLDIPEIRGALEKYCKANYTKMVFMDNKGKVDIINEEAGEWIDGCWYSNGGIKSYIGYGYSGAYYYNLGDVRHKGGRLTNMMFPESRRKNWARCPGCQGYFYKLKGICEDCKIFLKLKELCKKYI